MRQYQRARTFPSVLTTMNSKTTSVFKLRYDYECILKFPHEEFVGTGGVLGAATLRTNATRPYSITLTWQTCTYNT